MLRGKDSHIVRYPVVPSFYSPSLTAHMSLGSALFEAKRSASSVFIGDMSAEAGSTGSDNAHHIVVLIHGLWGNPVHLHHLRDTLAERHAEDGLHILIPKSNSDSHTYDGIEVGGERITHEIEQKIEELSKKGNKITKISVVGYSLGGLVARYVVGLLYKAGIFDNITPANFTTFATPHLGVRTPTPGYRAETWNWLGSKTLSTSGQQMFLVDDFRGTGRCLLDIMADPDSIFVRGLKMFNKRSVYANTINDKSVPFYTASMSRHDPFVDLDAVDVHYMPTDSEPKVILDPKCPVTLRQPESKALVKLSLAERLTLSERTRSSIPFYAVFFSLLPIAVPLFLVNAGYQTYQSTKRVKLHEAGAHIDLRRYRIPLLESTQMIQDHAVERLASNSGEEYLPTPPPEQNSPASSTTKVGSEADVEKAEGSDGPWPTLALTPDQFKMIDNLDRHVAFTKYPCYIQNVRHTHAAIVLRVPKDNFNEGRAVSAHWASEFEV